MIAYKDLLKNRRSVRDFKDEKISPSLLQEILQEKCTMFSNNLRRKYLSTFCW